MFREIIQTIIDKMNGEALGAVLMDKEGITVDKIAVDSKMDVETIAMEYSVVLKDIFKAAEMIQAGDVQEVFIRTGRFSTILRLLDTTYFIALFIKPGSNFGRGRFVLRAIAPELKKEL